MTQRFSQFSAHLKDGMWLFTHFNGDGAVTDEFRTLSLMTDYLLAQAAESSPKSVSRTPFG